MSNQMRNLLERPKVRTAIVDRVTWFWANDRAELQAAQQLDPLQLDALVDFGRSYSLRNISSIWRDQIASELNQPAALTRHDFVTAVATMFLNSPVDPQLTYESFVAFLDSVVRVRHRSRPIRAVIGHILANPQVQELLWKSNSGFEVTLLGGLPIQDEHWEIPKNDRLIVTSPQAIYLRLEGNCSAKAFRQFRRSVIQVLRCIFRSLSLIKTFNDPIRRFIPWEKYVRIGETFPEQDDHCIAPLLDAYYSNPTKSDSFGRRIRNALHLLVQSDQQCHTAIGIALSVAAIESLLCRDDGALTLTFAENTAALLEPDPRYRDAAETFAKKLYGARSKVLHGELLEHEAAQRRNARALAGAVLQAIMERQTFQRRAGVKSETPDDLINELRRGRWVPGQLTGVSESPVRTLWGAKYEGPPPETDDESTDQESESNE